MPNVVVKSPIQYLDRAASALKQVGVTVPKGEDAPINGLLQKISDLDQEKIAVIARTLGQASVFNEVVREHTQAMEIGDRYRDIAEGFNSVRDDAKKMVDQIADAKIDLLERVNNVWMKIARGDIADRFERIKKTYLEVTRSTTDQIERENAILEAYRDFRGALKQAEVLALDVLKIADRSGKRPKSSSVNQHNPLLASRAASLPSARVLSCCATSICAGPRTRKSATRSPRISRTI